MNTKNSIIRVIDLLPKENDKKAERAKMASSPEPQIGAFMVSESREGVLIKLFGDLPDYRDKRVDMIWNKFLEGGKEDATTYCDSKGIDIRDGHGSTVKAWCDIATMLKAMELGIISK